MYNHVGLFPAGPIVEIPSSRLADSELANLPEPEALARQVVDALKAAAPNAAISMADQSRAAFNNDIILETSSEGKKRIVHINPIDRSARVVTPPENKEQKEQTSLLNGVRNIRLSPNPYQSARASLPSIMTEAGFEDPSPATPYGWCKLNFLADINGAQARVTYVLRDGHVDITRFTGEDGMNP